MNQHLQSILNSLQQSEHLNDEEKNALAKAVKDAEKEFAITEFKLDRTEKVKRTTAILLEETIAELEQKRKDVEAQNRDLEIEAALEKVRSRSLAMNHSNELEQVVLAIAEKLSELGLSFDGIHIFTFNTEIRNISLWIATNHLNAPLKVNLPYDEKLKNNSVIKDLWNAIEKKDHIINKTYSGKTKDDYFKYVGKHNTSSIPDSVKQLQLELPEWTLSLATETNSMLGIDSWFGSSLTDDEFQILERFAKVFNQAFTRFLDLQKAEAQAREAQIEAALEKVRSASLAMHHSDELGKVVLSLFDRLKELDIPFDGASIFLFEKEMRNIQLWVASSISVPIKVLMPYDEKIMFNPIMEDLWNAIHKGDDIINKSYAGKVKDDYYRHVHKNNKLVIPESIIQRMLDAENWTISIATQNNSMICIDSWEGNVTSGDNFLIIKRFGWVFEQAYTRFLDLKKAEAQAREAQIQLALERVRARTMAMRKSEELRGVVKVLYAQLKELGFQQGVAAINIMDHDSGDIDSWSEGFDDGYDLPEKYHVPYFEHLKHRELIMHWKSGTPYATVEIAGQEKKSYDNYFFFQTDFVKVPETTKQFMMQQEAVLFSMAYMQYGALTWTPSPISDEQSKILQRFAKVFEQTYTRFLDLQKAEAQAREAQIQLALERVRASTMAMHKSDDLAKTAVILFEQLRKLGNTPDRMSIGIINEPAGLADMWLTDQAGHEITSNFALDLAEKTTVQKLFLGWKKGLKTMTVDLIDDEFKEWLKYVRSTGLVVNDEHFKNRRVHNIAFFSHGWLNISSLDLLPSEMMSILERFASVYSLTYRRFLDLQKAEAQAREAQIEAALERVRSKTMAMHSSEDVGSTVVVMFDELTKLGIKPFRCGIGIMQKGFQMEVWTARPGSDEKTALVIGQMNMNTHPLLAGAYSGWKNKENIFSYELKDDDLLDYFNVINNQQSEYPVKYDTASLPSQIFHHDFYFREGTLFVFSLEQLSQLTENIFKRFSAVFGQTYRRYLDLQKAEAQAREAKIEASLERVRSKTMAMHNSEDVSAATATMLAELEKLGIQNLRGGITIIREDQTQEVWSVNNLPDGSVTRAIGVFDMRRHPYWQQIFEAHKRKDDYDHYRLAGKDKHDYIDILNNTPGYLTKPIKELPDMHCESYNFGEGRIWAYSLQPHSEEQKQVMKRFASVFSLTFRRYQDLMKAEAQAREAQIETALERVRSRTLAMHKSDELAETSAVLFQQLILLGIEPNRLYISIVKDDKGETEFWITDEDGSKVSMAYEDNLNNNPTFKKMLAGWKKQQKSLVIDMKGEELQEYFTYLSSIHVPFKGGMAQQRRLQYIAYFNKGFIGMASPDEQPEDTLQLLERFAGVFNLTFTRFNDLKVAEAHALQAEQDLLEIKAARKNAEEALTELKSTQKQLIQSEKMASLGELTAGIAHEIQNPLNFVNNFSEVSNELIDEMKQELAKSNYEDANTIADDLKQNLEKINFHGKRAGDIVKGMLQHSRKSAGQKEPTDINALADEYLRLSYHGLRAKDKTFNATMKTDFDTTLEKVNIIPQDIGRVVLNLITNAFYAVNEKSKQNITGYEPIVDVSTKKEGNKVLIVVKDNGNGIPKSIVDKIFQPFFTTKPTGQGTGLGLSLSYDIVKAHGGEIKVGSKETEGSQFIILLPLS